MIGILEGSVRHLAAPMAYIMTASGVGYEVELPLTAFCQLHLSEPVTLWIHQQVREDAQLLYGFIHREEKLLFRKLLRINGVGAKMALAMLSAMSISELRQCVQQNDELKLTRIPGVGKKTAQRLLIELKDKLDDLGHPSSQLMASYADGDLLDGTQQNIDGTLDAISEGQVLAEVEMALINLGYRDKEAQAAIKAARLMLTEQKSVADHDHSKEASATFNTQQLLKATLQQLSRF